MSGLIKIFQLLFFFDEVSFGLGFPVLDLLEILFDGGSSDSKLGCIVDKAFLKLVVFHFD